MTNIYNILAKPPVLKKKRLPRNLREMASRLVASGRMRIDTDYAGNFVRLNLPRYGIDFTFSKRELTEPELSARTKKLLQMLLSRQEDSKTAASRATQYMEEMRGRIARRQNITPDIEEKLSYAIVQCNHPAVIELLLKEGTEIFITFSHNIGDMLDMQGWQYHGRNSGMQSIGHRHDAVYISCGGDPFMPEKDVKYAGDGFAALARLMIIGAQETGHFADMIRNKNGRIISRHSADIGGNIAKPKVKKARQQDLARTEKIIAKFESIGIKNAVEAERALKFYREKKAPLRRRIIFKLWSWLLYRFFRLRTGKYLFLKKMPRGGGYKKYPATLILSMLQDMKFNLAPKADVYMRDEEEAEEAIACVEALARVPQQAVKWGHSVTRALMRDLYNIYYSEVIPDCQKYLL